MGCKRKLRASTSCQAEGTSSESGIDRFSDLPEEVVHRILSLLNFRDLTRVGGLSKRCRQFHLSVPVVDFNSNWVPLTKTDKCFARLMSSFDRYFLDRGHNRLQRLHIDWSFLQVKQRRKFLIRSALTCNVEDLIFISEIVGPICFRCHLSSSILNLCALYQCACICSVRGLLKRHLNALYKEGSTPTLMLDSIRNLRIHCESFNYKFVPAVVSLLRRMPNLNIFTFLFGGGWVNILSLASRFGNGYWKLQNLAFIHQLKEVSIENSYGSNGIEFERYILEHAQNLKKILFIESCSDGEWEQMISTASVLIRQDPHKIYKIRGLGSYILYWDLIYQNLG